MRVACQSGKLKGRDWIGDLRADGEDAVEMTPKEVGCWDVCWIHLAQDVDQ
jgi:hypothetical protein